METINEIWNITVKSNTFNFLIMMLIIVIVATKIKLGEKLEGMKNDIAKNIENSNLEKSVAENELLQARKSIENLEEEVATRISNAKSDAKNLTDEILLATKNKIKQIEENTQKVINSEEKTISARLTNKAAQESIELAKRQIKDLLKENPQLHEKFIQQSISEL